MGERVASEAIERIAVHLDDDHGGATRLKPSPDGLAHLVNTFGS
jgi:hypothetical protein